MKKTLVLFGLAIVAIFLFLRNCGFTLGNIKIGKQPKFQTEQMVDFVSSDFYRDYYRSDSLVVINLWATWCEPCIEEMPDLNEVKKNFESAPIKFVSLSVDNDSIQLRKFLQKNTFKFDDITFTNLKYRTAIINTLDGRKPEENISMQAVPVTYILKNRKVQRRFDGQIAKLELTKNIQKLLQEEN